jgi:hypothetical protein
MLEKTQGGLRRFQVDDRCIIFRFRAPGNRLKAFCIKRSKRYVVLYPNLTKEIGLIGTQKNHLLWINFTDLLISRNKNRFDYFTR